jgi:hypothetical protein
VIDKLQSHYGFARTPFGRSLAPGMLHRHGTHAEAVAALEAAPPHPLGMWMRTVSCGVTPVCPPGGDQGPPGCDGGRRGTRVEPVGAKAWSRRPTRN